MIGAAPEQIGYTTLELTGYCIQIFIRLAFHIAGRFMFKLKEIPNNCIAKTFSMVLNANDGTTCVFQGAMYVAIGGLASNVCVYWWVEKGCGIYTPEPVQRDRSLTHTECKEA
jgi:hypothetical protein